MSQPISPKPVSSHGEKELPAYVSNGLIGLRVRDIPLFAGMALVSGFAGEHPERRIEAAATAPYPLAGDLAVNGVWMSDVFHQTCDLEQTYDFSAGESLKLSRRSKCVDSRALRPRSHSCLAPPA